MSQSISCKNYRIILNDWKALVDMVGTKYSKVLIVVDENTEEHCLPILNEYLDTDFYPIVIPAGEKYKNLQTAAFIWDEMLATKADRHSLCLNLGGGVIGDLGGWTAASFMRGMDFIQIPTTVLSMVDASVGGKLGIDFKGSKNMVGAIQDPKAVFVFTEFIQTLPRSEIRSGYAEVLKHGLIADQKYWDKHKALLPHKIKDWESTIWDSILIKKSVTEQDPYERGLRKILNFGHTLGHAIESHSFKTEKSLLHGEAIAIGMILEAHLSYQCKYMDLSELKEIAQSIVDIYGSHPGCVPELDILMPLLLQDKKNRGGEIRFSLLHKIGEATYNQVVTTDQIETALKYYRSI